jgi:hypothetical protein
VRTRIAQRVAAIAIGIAIPVFASAGPALAKLKPDNGEVPGPSLGAGNTILVFVVIPLGAFLVISGLSLLPSALKRPRYRPGKSWDHNAAWIGDPMEAAPAEAAAEAASTAKGGASAEW